jgi:hypothetical protein
MRLFSLCLVLLASLVVGCTQKSTSERKETVSTPGGTTTTTDKRTVESSGENPPANRQGQTGQ